jgi:hypothetical protein
MMISPDCFARARAIAMLRVHFNGHLVASFPKSGISKVVETKRGISHLSHGKGIGQGCEHCKQRRPSWRS